MMKYKSAVPYVRDWLEFAYQQMKQRKVVSQGMPSFALWLKFLQYLHRIYRIGAFWRRTYELKDEDAFPAVVIGCEFDGVQACGRSSAFKHKKNRNWVSAIQSQIDYYKNHKNELVASPIKPYWGTCAENLAAERVLKEHDKKKNTTLVVNANLKDLVFTLPIRPRTAEYIPACRTCATIYTPCPII